MKHEASLDMFFKNILRNRIFLAHIMKHNIEEYKDESIQSIMDCIEPIGNKIVHPKRIGALRNESSEDGASIFYDSVFYAALPHEKNKIALIINVEAQSRLEGRSHVLSRGNYYNARNISSQYESHFTHAQYDDLLKVISIWIILEPALYKQGCINRYRMMEEHIIGNVKEDKRYFDKQEMIVLYLSHKESINPSMNILWILADRDISFEEKKEKLEEFDIVMDSELEKEVRSMCDYSAYVKRGGMEEGLFVSLHSLMENMKIDLREAMKLLNIPESEYDKYKEMMK